MFSTDILFTGFYGQSNTGDDAFVEVAAFGAKHFWGKKNVRFLAKKNKLPSTIVPVKGYPFPIPKTYKNQAEMLLNRTDALVYAGGSTIHGKIKPSSIRAKAFEKKLTKNQPIIGAIGVSIGPFKTSADEKAVMSYLKRMDFLAVRDETSYEIAKSFNLPFQPINAFDLAALLPKIYAVPQKTTQRQKKVIGVSVCPYESVQRGLDINNEKKRNETTIALLKEIDRREDTHFRFYIINGNKGIGDRSITERTIHEARLNSSEIVEYSRSVETVWQSIASCDFFISTRLHAAIFACFSNVPFMLNEYHRKCTDFLFNVGYYEQYRMFDSEYNVKEKANQILEVINNDAEYVFPSKRDEMEERAQLNFSAINF